MEADLVADILLCRPFHEARDVGHPLGKFSERSRRERMQASPGPHITRVVQGEQIVVVGAAACGVEKAKRVIDLSVDVAGEQQAGNQQIRAEEARRIGADL